LALTDDTDVASVTFLLVYPKKTHNEDELAMKSAITAFWEGLRARSWIPLIGGMLIVGFILMAVEVFVRTGLFTIIPEGYLLTRSSDQFTHLNYKLHSLRKSKSHRKSVYFLGGSALREALDEKVLNEKMGKTYDIHNLGSMQQSFGLSIAMLDQLPKGPGLVVIGTNIKRFTFSPTRFFEHLESNYYMIRSPSLVNFARENKIQFEPDFFFFPGVMNYFKFYVWNNKETLLKWKWPHYTFDPFLYHSKSPMKEKIQKEKSKKIKATYQAQFARFYDLNRKALTFLVELARKKGYEVALMDLPINPSIESIFNDITKIYRERIRTLSDSLSVPYLDFVWEMNFENEEFYDPFHLLEPGREKFQKALLTQLRSH